MPGLSRILDGATYKIVRKMVGGAWKLLRDCCCAPGPLCYIPYRIAWDCVNQAWTTPEPTGTAAEEAFCSADDPATIEGWTRDGTNDTTDAYGRVLGYYTGTFRTGLACDPGTFTAEEFGMACVEAAGLPNPPDDHDAVECPCRKCTPEFDGRQVHVEFHIVNLDCDGIVLNEHDVALDTDDNNAPCGYGFNNDGTHGPVVPGLATLGFNLGMNAGICRWEVGTGGEDGGYGTFVEDTARDDPEGAWPTPIVFDDCPTGHKSVITGLTITWI